MKTECKTEVGSKHIHNSLNVVVSTDLVGHWRLSSSVSIRWVGSLLADGGCCL